MLSNAMRNSPELRRSPLGDAPACRMPAPLARPGGTLLAVLPVNGGADRMAIVSFLLPAPPARGAAGPADMARVTDTIGPAQPGSRLHLASRSHRPGTGRPASTARRPGRIGPPGAAAASAIPARSSEPVTAIHAVRSMPDAAGTTGDGLVLDPASRRVLADGRDTGLAYLQFELLQFLMRHAGRAFTRRQLFAAVWRDGADEVSRSVDIHIHRIRRKLGPEYSRRLVTVRRVGYLYQQPAEY
jgi:hypothetical protein